MPCKEAGGHHHSSPSPLSAGAALLALVLLAPASGFLQPSIPSHHFNGRGRQGVASGAWSQRSVSSSRLRSGTTTSFVTDVLRGSSLVPDVEEEDDEDDESFFMAGQAARQLFSEADRRFMRRALELAVKAQGKTRPNPMVGCVVVNDEGVVMGEGFHPKAGEPHAEVFALREAGDKAKGATAYVSLEPCNHHGRTPPCVDALVKAGVRKVVAGMVDPFPLVAGKGLGRLRDNGIEVVVGCEEEKCRELNKAFIHRVLHKAVRGQLHLTYHDGTFSLPSTDNLIHCLAGDDGDAARIFVPHDAIIAEGAEGAAWLASSAADMPDSATRVVIMTDSMSASLPAEAPLWEQAAVAQEKGASSVLVFARGPLLSSEDEAAVAALRGKGVEVVLVEEEAAAAPAGGPSSSSLLMAVQSHLYERGMLSALWVLGGESAKEAVIVGCIQDLSVYASLVEADELDDMAERFGRPMRVSVMSCDALQTQACLLSVEVDSHGQQQQQQQQQQG